MSQVPEALAETVVMKFGGTSVADAERIKAAARRIVQRKEEGNQVVAVLSARGKTTDELVEMAHGVSDRPHPREMDMLLSTGERVSCALAAMVINDLGHEAISLTGSQAGIVTDTSHTKARILDVRADRIRRALDEGKIVLVAGFQGVSTSADVTTLGRGGSDTTAVALAAALGADVCEIFTDVAGVFSADPRIVPDARKLPVVTFEEMLEMAASGAGVLQLRSVEYARNHRVQIHCRSSFEDGPGTLVLDEHKTMERPLVTAVTHSTDEARVTLTGLPDRPGIAGRVLTALSHANVNVDMIIQNEPESEGHVADMSFTVPRGDLLAAQEALEPLKEELGIGQIATDESMGKVSVVGAGMKSHPGVAAKTFTVLGDAGVNIEMISTSPIKISCVVHEADVETAVRELHTAFALGSDAVRREEVAGDHRPVVAPDARPPVAGGEGGMRVAVVGATGAVGSTMLGVMRERAFPVEEVVALASERSAGRTIDFGGIDLEVRPLSDEAIDGFDIALFSAGSTVSAEWAPKFAEAGAVVVDNSSHWRMHEEVPLVVAEVNPEDLRSHRGIVANPNCSTMQMVVALKPILDAAGIERIVVSTYQSVSGTGQRAVEELHDQTRAVVEADELPPPAVYPHQIAFNVLPQVETFKVGDDYTTEERKMMRETRKILGRGDIAISATCARVPVYTGHSESINVQTREPLSPEECREVLSAAPGVVVVDDPHDGLYPLAIDAAGRDDVLVGRIRRDPSHERCLNLWVVGDNLRKGAATNAVQLAELLHVGGFLRSAPAA